MKHLTTLLSVFIITGCSYIPGMSRIIGEDGYFRDRQGDYLDAETIPRTQVPDELDSFIMDDLLVVPAINAAETVAYLDVPRPRPVQARGRSVVIQRMGKRSWIIADASPSQTWPRVRDFWRSRDIELAYENPTGGIMETGWFIQTANVLTKEKIKVIIEPGFQSDSAEIKLLHLSLSQATPVFEQINWPEESSDLDFAYNMLSELSVYLAEVSGLYVASSVSFLAGRISGEGKAFLTTGPDGTELLLLDADYQRSWAAVGRALERAGVTIIDKSQELGLYEVVYSVNNGEEEEEGFFKRIISRSRDHTVGHSLIIQIQNSDSVVEVLIESLEPEESQTEESAEAETSLLQTIRDFIA